MHLTAGGIGLRCAKAASIHHTLLGLAEGPNPEHGTLRETHNWGSSHCPKHVVVAAQHVKASTSCISVHQLCSWADLAAKDGATPRPTASHCARMVNEEARQRTSQLLRPANRPQHEDVLRRSLSGASRDRRPDFAIALPLLSRLCSARLGSARLGSALLCSALLCSALCGGQRVEQSLWKLSRVFRGAQGRCQMCTYLRG